MDQSTLWNSIREYFQSSCCDYDHIWMIRRRVFDTYSIITSVLDLVAGTEPSYVSVMERFQGNLSIVPSASSFCEARSKIPSYIFSEINRDLYDHITDITEPLDWFGYTPLAMDGSIIHLPAKLHGKGFNSINGKVPSALLTSLVRLSDRVVLGLRLSPIVNERGAAHEFLDELESDNLIVYDRGYLSFGLLNDHVNQSIAAVFRVSSGNVFKELQEFMQSNQEDKIITIDPPDNTYRNAKKTSRSDDVGPIDIRVMKYKIGQKTYVLATTILDKSIPKSAFKNLYKNRWQIEEFLKSFKVTIATESFHSLSVNGIEQEIHAAGILWNLSRGLDLVSRPFKKSLQLPKFITLSM